MIEPGRYDITIHQGATFDLPLQYISSGVAVNMTGYSIEAEFALTLPVELASFVLVGKNITLTKAVVRRRNVFIF